jgi:signal transduction histidine kinase
MLSSSGRGVLIAGFAIVTWIAADAAEPGPYTLSGFVRNQLPEFLAFVAIIFLLATLRDALGEAHAADLRSRAFLSDAAHQLRTPAASLQASAETLIMSAPDDDREPLLLLVANEAQRMSRLTNALLQIARLDQGEATVTRPVDLVRVCTTEVDLVRHRLSAETAVTLDTDLDPEGPVNIDADATREALANLLDNARRHARRLIAIEVRRRGDDLTITVTDDGPGITFDREERAFERFASLDGHGGTGLGLPIARAYIEVQGGTLTYEAGAFVIRLPV